jgi:hypothetical protein
MRTALRTLVASTAIPFIVRDADASGVSPFGPACAGDQFWGRYDVISSEVLQVMQRPIALAVNIFSAVFLLFGIAVHAQSKQTDEDLGRHFASMATAQPYVCGDSIEDSTEKVEDTIVRAAEDRVLEALNAGVHAPVEAKAVIVHTLEPFAKLSAQTETVWPKETRWSFEILEMLPALAIQFTYRDKAHFRILGIVQDSKKVNHRNGNI